ncbi:H-NS histone family protein [Cupriavidus sp. WGlv3]|uniref:H-NS histone family protein n=1 Tax=Cupriavidus sp. WGlv3 TaxID=2919924 RepID=UPI0020910EA4|nr:H-NS histone family protein [Cupriavidus sp. WGlv3]MCO4861246.1 H-NS histone family protein [Cupriavidus sp. WGlv3]
MQQLVTPLFNKGERILTMLSFNAPNSPLVNRLSDTQLLRERSAAILWVKSQMAKHGIAIDDLVASGCFAEATPTTNRQKVHLVRYRDAYGHTWDGNGDLPEWLQRAVNAGQSADHFRAS